MNEGARRRLQQVLRRDGSVPLHRGGRLAQSGNGRALPPSHVPNLVCDKITSVATGELLCDVWLDPLCIIHQSVALGSRDATKISISSHFCAKGKSPATTFTFVVA